MINLYCFAYHNHVWYCKISFFPNPRKSLRGASYSYFAPELPEVEEMDIDDSAISLQVQFRQLNTRVSMSLST